jgi:hypothetical protein
LSVIQPLESNKIEKVIINEEFTIDNYSLSYGSVFHGDLDGILIITDAYTSEEVARIIYDDLGLEEFLYIADIGSEEILIVCRKYYLPEGFEEPLFKETLLLKYNLRGEKISEIKFQNEPEHFGNHLNQLVITYQDESVNYINGDLEFLEQIEIDEEYIESYSAQHRGIAYVNGVIEDHINIEKPGYYDISIVEKGYTYLYSIVINPNVIVHGEKYGDTYIGRFSIEAGGDIELNGEHYLSNETINIPGNYIISIYGPNNYMYQETITVLPLITYSLAGDTYDFIDELSVSESICIYSNGITILINGELYNSELISETGVYSLTIYGINNMQFDLSFYIYPDLIGLENDGVYEKVEFTIFGNAILNGEYIFGEVYLDVPGIYSLDLLMGENVYKTYNFIINETLISTDEIEISKFNYNYIFYAFIALGCILILRKK